MNQQKPILTTDGQYNVQTNDLLNSDNNNKKEFGSEKVVFRANICSPFLIFFIIWTILCIGIAILFIYNKQYSGLWLPLVFFLICLIIVHMVPLYSKIIFDPLTEKITFKSYRYIFCFNKTREINRESVQNIIIRTKRFKPNEFDIILVQFNGEELKVLDTQDDTSIKDRGRLYNYFKRIFNNNIRITTEVGNGRRIREMYKRNINEGESMNNDPAAPTIGK